MALAQPYDRPRDFAARMLGLGRPVFWSLAATSFLGVAGALAGGAWAVYETRYADEQVKRYVVYLDAGLAPVGQSTIAASWYPSAGSWLEAARSWIREVRTRPTDMTTFEAQRRDMIWRTDARVYDRLLPLLTKQDNELRNTAVDVTSISANVKDADRARAVVFVRWTEQVRNASPAPTTWTAALTLGYLEPKAQAQMDKNPLGIFVTDFQISQETK